MLRTEIERKLRRLVVFINYLRKVVQLIFRFYNLTENLSFP